MFDVLMNLPERRRKENAEVCVVLLKVSVHGQVPKSHVVVMSQDQHLRPSESRGYLEFA